MLGKAIQLWWRQRRGAGGAVGVVDREKQDGYAHRCLGRELWVQDREIRMSVVIGL